MRVSLVNVKGGVGKTTTAVNLAAAMTRGGLQTLVVDLDPQASATLSLGLLPEGTSPSAAQVVTGEVSLPEAIHETDFQGIHLVPGSVELAGAELALARKQAPEKRLRDALAPVRRRYDITLIDCPPGLSLLSINGLVAADAYIVPVTPHHLDRESLDRLFHGLETLRDRIGKLPELLGILLTMVDHRTKVTDEVVHEIRRTYGQKVFRTEIPVNVRLAEAAGYGRPIFSHESWSTGALAYNLLGGEVLRRARKGGLF